MNYSYWENKEWFNGNDFTIVGSGIVGLTLLYFYVKNIQILK